MGHAVDILKSKIRELEDDAKFHDENSERAEKNAQGHRQNAKQARETIDELRAALELIEGGAS